MLQVFNFDPNLALILGYGLQEYVGPAQIKPKAMGSKFKNVIFSDIFYDDFTAMFKVKINVLWST